MRGEPCRASQRDRQRGRGGLVVAEAAHFAGVAGDVTVHAGEGLSQPAGVAHNVVARSDDLEVLEINVPAAYGTWALDVPPAPWDRAA